MLILVIVLLNEKSVVLILIVFLFQISQLFMDTLLSALRQVQTETVLRHSFTWHTTRIRVQTAPLCSHTVPGGVRTVPGRVRTASDGSRRLLVGPLSSHDVN